MFEDVDRLRAERAWLLGYWAQAQGVPLGSGRAEAAFREVYAAEADGVPGPPRKLAHESVDLPEEPDARAELQPDDDATHVCPDCGTEYVCATRCGNMTGCSQPECVPIGDGERVEIVATALLRSMTGATYSVSGSADRRWFEERARAIVAALDGASSGVPVADREVWTLERTAEVGESGRKFVAWLSGEDEDRDSFDVVSADDAAERTAYWQRRWHEECDRQEQPDG